MESVTVPVLKFTHHGIERTLVKHPAYVRALKDGVITSAQLRQRPWNLRLEGNGKVEKFKLAAGDKDALRQAKDILNGQRDKPSDFAEWINERNSRRGITLGELARDWRQLKYPDHNGRPRSVGASDNVEVFLATALNWWEHVPAVAAETKFAEFITWRRAHSKRGNGERSADLELNSLSCLCRWAVFAGRIKTNPFRKRPTFRNTADITHCHQSMPSSDEELHAILTWFWQARPAPAMDPKQVEKSLARLRQHTNEENRRLIAGAWLAWCSLTGLRPGEPLFLIRHNSLEIVPASPKNLAPGTVFPTRDGKQKMKVHRLKRGQNPYVNLHPAAAEFLAGWNHWLAGNVPNALHLFPDPEHPDQALCSSEDTTFLNGLLEQACLDCKIAPCKPHGFGRGYYVRVRRSQGTEDPTIAGELGQTTNGKLIRDTYGDPDDMVGGALFDWLPENGQPAWKLLTEAVPANVIAYSRV